MDQGDSARHRFKTALYAALPICLGYVPLGAACGILSAKAGLMPVQVLLLSVFLYAGGGQFMVANLSMAGVPSLSVAASISLMNARHMLYGSALAKYFSGINRNRIIAFGLEMTDESFGVNFSRFIRGGWLVQNARIVNSAAHVCWIASTMLGVYAGNLIPIALPVIAFSMTSMFICLLCMQEHTRSTLVRRILRGGCGDRLQTVGVDADGRVFWVRSAA